MRKYILGATVIFGPALVILFFPLAHKLMALVMFGEWNHRVFGFENLGITDDRQPIPPLSGTINWGSAGGNWLLKKNAWIDPTLDVILYGFVSANLILYIYLGTLLAKKIHLRVKALCSSNF